MNWMRVAAGLTACAALTVAGCADTTDQVLAPDDGAAPTEVAAPQFSKTAATGNTYLLTADQWNKAHTKAVLAAGGKVTLSHKASGIGIAMSDDPDFLSNVLASDLFIAGQVDETVEWQPPARIADARVESVTPGDETFYLAQWSLEAIDAPAAWNAGYDGSGARVAVIDGGINDTHIDLLGQVDVACSASFVPGEPFNNDVGGFWHGSHVAGIVAAADNGLGTIGVAPGATIMGVKALHGGSGLFSWIIAGILFASDPGSFSGFESCDRADIINMSLAGIWFKRFEGGLHSAITKAVNFAASKGVLVLSAAANNGIDVRDFADLTIQPAMAGSGLAISATAPEDWCLGNDNFTKPASYSNYGNGFVTLAGPGGDFDGSSTICSIPRLPLGSGDLVREAWIFDMVMAPCGGFGGTFSCWAAGTSMATPAVAGVAALIVDKYPGISLGKLKAKLKKSAEDAGPRAFYGHGFVNAYNAVN